MDIHPALHPAASPTSFLDWCQDQVAKLTMQSADYEEYSEVVRRFWSLDIPYKEFRRRLRVLLRNPSHAHLRKWWKIYHREVTGEAPMEFDPLFPIPLALLAMANLLLQFVPIQHGICFRAAQWTLEQSLSRLSQLELIMDDLRQFDRLLHSLNRGLILRNGYISNGEDAFSGSYPDPFSGSDEDTVTE